MLSNAITKDELEIGNHQKKDLTLGFPCKEKKFFVRGSCNLCVIFEIHEESKKRIDDDDDFWNTSQPVWYQLLGVTGPHQASYFTQTHYDSHSRFWSELVQR